jgi:multiple sugar transport system permease protein
MTQARRSVFLAGQAVAYLALAVYAVLCIYPFIWMASAAFKTYDEVLKNLSPIPWAPTLTTLTETWSKLHFFNYFFNSLKVSLLTVVGILFIYSLAAYAFAFIEFRGRDTIFVFFLSMLLVPGITVLLPLVILERRLGLLGTHAGLILPTINGSGPFAVFLLRNYFLQTPRELHDAARVDGANEWQIYWRIYLWLAMPALVTVAIINFLASWNTYLLPSIVLSKEELFTLPLGMQNLLLTNVTHWNEVMAGACISVVPVIIIFLVLQKYYVAGLSGALKG